ncbi:MAG: class I adenylate-forming enzyme family protein [Oscillospiraceae bacterium]|nr:class I adenylate-forming enzyme family protein [Oscillospiraceae bacterium]
MNYNYFDFFEKYAEETGSKPLITIDDVSLTYHDFHIIRNKLASALKMNGISENKKVGLIIPNSLVWYKIFWSAIQLGAQPVPMDPQSGELELNRLLDVTTVEICFVAIKYRNNHILETVKKIIGSHKNIRKIVVVDESFEDTGDGLFVSFNSFLNEAECKNALPVYQADDDHVMSLACTSGSTGNPKVLSVPYQGFYEAIKDISDYLEFNSDDVMMIGMPLYHQGGFGMGLQTVMKGGSVIYQPQFEPVKFLKTVEKYKVSVIQLTSTLAKILLSVPDFDSYDLSTVKVCYFAGEVLPRDIADFFVKKLHIRVINVIGSSETATMVVWDSDTDFETDPSDFRELPFTKTRVIDDFGNPVEPGTPGELCIFTTAVIFNYFGNPEESKSKVVNYDGKRWFRTGDLVTTQPDGRLRFVGRSKRIIKRGANLVHAEEVESFILTHPKIQAVAVTAEDHPVIGQQIVAYIQTVDNEKITRGNLASYFAGKLAAYKIPDKVVITEDLPKDIGKIQFKYIRK